MMEYTHRDRRAHRGVGRAFWAMVGAALALTGLALGVPTPLVGIAAVVGLGVLGAVYIGWADQFLASYAADLRLARDGGEKRDFSRVEARSSVGLERTAGQPSARSPHVRRRPIGTGDGSNGPTTAAVTRTVTPNPDSPVPPAGGP